MHCQPLTEDWVAQPQGRVISLLGASAMGTLVKIREKKLKDICCSLGCKFRSFRAIYAALSRWATPQNIVQSWKEKNPRCVDHHGKNPEIFWVKESNREKCETRNNCLSKEGAIFNEPRRFVSNHGNGLCNYTTKLTFRKQSSNYYEWSETN